MEEVVQMIIQFDHFIFRLINQSWNVPGLDGFFLAITDLHKLNIFKFGVFPILIGLGIFFYRLKFLKWLLALALVIAVTDAFNYRVLKSFSQRSRPAFVPSVETVLRTEKSPTDPSFPSNHAINITAGAVLFSAVMPHLSILFYVFAGLVVYSRPYLGLHFPLDVLVGSLLGFCIARIMIAHIFRRFRWWAFPKRRADGEH